MNTFKKIIATILILAGLGVSSYGSAPYIKVTTYDDKKFFVVVSVTDSSRVNVSLKDSHNFELYQESYKGNNNYIKGFDLEPLPDGEYLLEIESKQRIERFTLSIKNNWLSVNQESRLVMHKPSVTQKGTKVDVALADTHSPLKLSILDRSNEVIFQETVADNGRLTRRYDISQLDPGQYTVLVEMRGRNFRQSIYIE